MRLSYSYNDKKKYFENKKYFKTLENFYKENYYYEKFKLDINLILISVWRK